MKIFNCRQCGELLNFEDHQCPCCGSELGFVPEQLDLFVLEQSDFGKFSLLRNAVKRDRITYKACSNREYNACNWLIPSDQEHGYCRACELNRIIPDLSDAGHLRRWRQIESAKHRLIYALLQMQLPVVSKARDYYTGMGFNFLADSHAPQKVMTGHQNGLITLNIEEADDDKREWYRRELQENYRTLLGHFRHESGHYYWDRLIAGTGKVNEFRALFGDERENYGQSLNHYYTIGAPGDWQEHYISRYATAHPWEDWAETWAHYLHIMDTLETADAFRLKVDPRVPGKTSQLKAHIRSSPYNQEDFGELLKLWAPLIYALNSTSRSMGNGDTYPFLISAKVTEKLDFIHRVCVTSRVSIATAA